MFSVCGFQACQLWAKDSIDARIQGSSNSKAGVDGRIPLASSKRVAIVERLVRATGRLFPTNI